MVWIEFLICASLMTFFAYHLSKEGIIISEKTHLEEGIIGMFFLAIATSFPEIITAATSVFHLGKVGLGYGDIIGSIMVNLMILFFIDYSYGKGRILNKVSGSNRLTGIFVLIVLAVVMSAILLNKTAFSVPSFRGVGAENILILGLYLACLIIIKRRGEKDKIELYNPNSESFLQVWTKFIVLLAIVLVTSLWLAKIGEKITLTTALSETFTGTLLLGFTTSLPEIIVSFAALRAGSLNMAVGNILGSCLFDICILPLLDVLYRSPILKMLSRGQVLATGIVTIMALVVILGFRVKRESLRRLNWDTGLIFAIGLAGFVLLYYVK